MGFYGGHGGFSERDVIISHFSWTALSISHMFASSELWCSISRKSLKFCGHFKDACLFLLFNIQFYFSLLSSIKRIIQKKEISLKFLSFSFPFTSLLPIILVYITLKFSSGSKWIPLINDTYKSKNRIELL